MKPNSAPFRAIRRLPSYRAALMRVVLAGATRVSSAELAALCGVSAPQVRQDLHWFGSFGRQGCGYSAHELLASIDRLLNGNGVCHLALVGFGPLGQALINHPGFLDGGFRFVVAFDTNSEKVGHCVHGLTVLPMSHLREQIHEHHVQIGVVAVSREEAQDIADLLTEAGVKGIWNLSPIKVRSSCSVAVENICLDDSLMALAYRVRQTEPMIADAMLDTGIDS